MEWQTSPCLFNGDAIKTKRLSRNAILSFLIVGTENTNSFCFCYNNPAKQRFFIPERCFGDTYEAEPFDYIGFDTAGIC
jgi:hypothetical protein